MAALPEPKPHPTSSSPRVVEWEEMHDPVHPMHQELLRRVSAEPATAASAIEVGWSRPARLAFAFYAALTAWGMVIAVAVLVFRVA